MGEKKNGKEQGEKNNGEKKDTSVVLKIEMHCDGCAKKIIKSIKRFEGVEDVHADSSTSKVTVFGKVDPLKLREKVESKTKKKVELISPLPKKEKESKETDKKPEEKSEKKKETQVATVTFKTKLHCDGCTEKIYKSVMKIKGVESVTIDKLKELVTVKGTMDVKELPSQLKKKHNRSVEIVAPKKEDKKEGGDKKEKASGGEKKQVEEANKADLANKMDYYGPGGYGYGYGNPYGYPQGGAGHGYGYGYPPPPPQGGGGQGYGYGYSYPPPPPPPQGGGYVVNSAHPPQMFSDENPNACSVM